MVYRDSKPAITSDFLARRATSHPAVRSATGQSFSHPPGLCCAPPTYLLEAMGTEAFAERARRELTATGERPRNRTEALSELTAQKAQVVQLARDGLSNPEIGGRLFVSALTV